MDPEYPSERLMFMLEDTGASVLLTRQYLRERVPLYSGRCVDVDAVWHQLREYSVANFGSGVGGNNLAYVIYTSGSTGRPKGVMAVMREEELWSLETIIAAGEACGEEIVEKWGRGRRFIDAYGPTEGTVCASLGECEAGGNRRPSIGRPMANTRLYILDGE